MRPAGLVLLGVALLPALAVFAARVAVPSPEETWHWKLALASAALVVWGGRRLRPGPDPDLRLARGAWLAYGLALLAGPPLAVGVAGALALGTTVSALFLGGRAALGLAGLFALSLKLVPTLRAWLGYPLQVLSASLAAGGLQLGGLAVERIDTALAWGGHVVQVVPGCAGLRMLWAGSYLACLMACGLGLGAARSALLFLAAPLLLVLANAIRIMVFFGAEVSLFRLTGWLHQAVGLAIFALAALAVVWLARRLAGRALGRSRGWGCGRDPLPAR